MKTKESKVGNNRIGIHAPGHPHANNRGYVLRYRIILEEHLGRELRSDEHVHHKDGDTRNDSIDNLEILTCAQHTARHRNSPENVPAYYEKLKALMSAGNGYKRCAKELGMSVHTVRDAYRRLRRGGVA